MKQYSKLTEQQHLVVNEVMDVFDFESVKKHMDHVNWGWSMGGVYAVPDIPELRRSLRALLVDAFVEMNEFKESKDFDNSPVMISTGGFTVIVWSSDYCNAFFNVAELYVDPDELK
jgi:hypothetical protein